MNFVLYICGGPRDGEVLMETKSLNAAMIAARAFEKQLDDEDAAIGIDSDDGPVPQ